MAPDFIPTPTDGDAMRHRLARYGVSLFERMPADRGPDPTVAELAECLTALAESKDARLDASIPCLLTAFAGDRALAALTASAAARPELAAHLGWHYRLARALVISRRFDLERVFRATADLPPSALEPLHLPDPSVHFGEMTLWMASEISRDRSEPDAAGAVIRLFDKWIRLRADELASARA